jgi:hypothetical protein
MKHEWGKESYIDECERKEGVGIIYLETVRDWEGI